MRQGRAWGGAAASILAPQLGLPGNGGFTHELVTLRGKHTDKDDEPVVLGQFRGTLFFSFIDQIKDLFQEKWLLRTFSWVSSWTKAIVYFNGGGAVGGACGAKFAHVCCVSTCGIRTFDVGQIWINGFPTCQS